MEITGGWPWHRHLIKLINPSLPINLLVPLPVWRQMSRTEDNLLCSCVAADANGPMLRRYKKTLSSNLLHTLGGDCILIFTLVYATKQMEWFLTKLSHASHRYINMFPHNYTQLGASLLSPWLLLWAQMKWTPSIISLRKQSYSTRHLSVTTDEMKHIQSFSV